MINILKMEIKNFLQMKNTILIILIDLTIEQIKDKTTSTSLIFKRELKGWNKLIENSCNRCLRFCWQKS